LEEGMRFGTTRDWELPFGMGEDLSGPKEFAQRSPEDGAV